MSKLLDVHHASDPTPLPAAVPREINLARVSRHLVVGDFTASMAHEVRQPLTAIIANAETCLRMLRGTPEVDEIIAALTDIVDAGHRANQLVRRNGDLLRDPPTAKAAVDITEVVREVTSLARARLQANGVKLSLSLVDVLMVDGNHRELQHVFLNLIANALTAMEVREPAERLLEIETTVTAEDLILVTIADSGCGLDSVDLDRIFLPFHTTKPSALGMGLPISRLIVERHGGKLWAEPRDGRGARFCLTLAKVRVS
jgi:signal transduction histidine kinase